MEIIPAIMETGFEEADKKLGRISILKPWVQIDVVDNVLTKGRTFEPELLTKSQWDLSAKLFDMHLMVKEPVNWIEKGIFISANRIIGQVEMMSDREDFVDKVKGNGIEAGLGFDIETEIDEIPDETDVVLLMGRKAGFESLEMDERIWKRIETLKEIQKDGKYRFRIGVDGGVNLGNIEKLNDSGVDIAYCTAAIFDGDVENNYLRLKNLVDSK